MKTILGVVFVCSSFVLHADTLADMKAARRRAPRLAADPRQRRVAAQEQLKGTFRERSF
jgi:hypothetical protein